MLTLCYHHMPLKMRQNQNLGKKNFFQILSLLPLGASIFHKHILMKTCKFQSLHGKNLNPSFLSRGLNSHSDIYFCYTVFLTIFVIEVSMPIEEVKFYDKLLYSWAMKTQHPNVHQYLKDIFNILSQRISGDFMNTKDRQHIGFKRGLMFIRMRTFQP